MPTSYHGQNALLHSIQPTHKQNEMTSSHENMDEENAKSSALSSDFLEQRRFSMGYQDEDDSEDDEDPWDDQNSTSNTDSTSSSIEKQSNSMRHSFGGQTSQSQISRATSDDSIMPTESSNQSANSKDAAPKKHNIVIGPDGIPLPPPMLQPTTTTTLSRPNLGSSIRRTVSDSAIPSTENEVGQSHGRFMLDNTVLSNAMGGLRKTKSEESGNQKLNRSESDGSLTSVLAKQLALMPSSFNQHMQVNVDNQVDRDESEWN